MRSRTAPLKGRGLRRGDEGAAVLRLQERLAALGYDPGPPDGRFGYWTEDALRTFQRDYRLRVDGVAGGKVNAALRDDLPQRRVVHVVGHRERLSDIAAAYGMTVSAVRWMNGLSRRRPLRPGDRLVIRRTYVLGQIAAGTSPRLLAGTLLPRRTALTEIALPPAAVDSKGRIEWEIDGGEDDEFAPLAEEGGWRSCLTITGARQSLGEVLCRPRAARSLATQLVSGPPWRANGHGIVLDLGRIPAGRGDRVLKGLARLKEAAPDAAIVPIVDVPRSGWRSYFSDLDFERLAAISRRIVVATHRWERLLDTGGNPPAPHRIERFVAAASARLPSWKILLGVPFGAWGIRKEGAGDSLSYRAAATEGYCRRMRWEKDENGFVVLNLPPESESAYVRLVAATRDVVARYLALTHRYRLEGVYLSAIGEEDRRLWDVCAHRILAARSE